MTKKKPKASADSANKTADVPPDPIVADQKSATSATAPPTQQPTIKAEPAQTSQLPPTLIICRNKHWRHISSYHGPWLNLPTEVLENLAFTNFHSPRPRPIDPAVFFDLVKIRRLIDDASSLAVRAANGTTSASLHTSMNGSNGLFNSADAEILGIGSARGGGGHAKLSRERKHRMREHATQKLSHAYQLDEIATSVATMQATSAIDDVARHVLQRNEQDPDAQYVHFFHEKVPSLAMAHYTTLDPLDNVIRHRPMDASHYRTRAVARIFKDDIEGAARDCTEGLAVHRLCQPQYQNGQQDLVWANDVTKSGRGHSIDARVEEKDQPSSLEPQLLFQRGGAYLAMACDSIPRALYSGQRQGSVSQAPQSTAEAKGDAGTDAAIDETKSQAEARKLVRTYAKRALRDYMSFLSHLDYTPGLPEEYTDAFLEKLRSNGYHGDRLRSEKPFDIDAVARSGLTEALVKYEGQKQSQTDRTLPPMPKPVVHKLDALFGAVSPADIPPFPPAPDKMKNRDHLVFSLPGFSEDVTYHPLLMDVLHSLLLCHCLLQTSTKEHLRHAYMAARVARLCDGYPILLAPRSPSRADWMEILQRSKNWLGLDGSWERLCSPMPVPGQGSQAKSENPQASAYEKYQAKVADIKAIVAAERKMAKEAYRTGLRAQELKAAQDAEAASKGQGGTKVAHGNGGGHMNGTDVSSPPLKMERAEAITRWILEAPPPTSTDGSGRPKKRSGAKARLRKAASAASSLTEAGLEQSVDSLELVD